MNFNIIQNSNKFVMTRFIKFHYILQLSSIPTFKQFHSRSKLTDTSPIKSLDRNLKNYTICKSSRSNLNKNYSINKSTLYSREVNSTYLIHTVFYTEPDEIIDHLNSSKDINELLNKVHNYGTTQLDHKHLVQSVILLWSFCQNLSDETIALMRIPSDERVDYLLASLHTQLPSMNLEELSCCYLYLRRLGVDNSHILLRDILINALDVIKETSPSTPVSLFSLSRLSVAINHGKDFFTPLVCTDFIPHIKSHIEKCETSSDARQIAICLFNLQPLITDELELFKLKVKELLRNKALNAQTKAIIKLLQMLNMPMWAKRNSKLIRSLLLALSDSIDDLSDFELRHVCRIFHYNMEPASLMQPLRDTTFKRLKIKPPTIEALVSYLPFSEPQNRNELTELFTNLLNCEVNWNEQNNSSYYFTILRSLKISNSKLCDFYWSKVVDDINEATDDQVKQWKIIKHSHRYMNFNNNLGGTYRNEPLERTISWIAMNAIEKDIAGRVPQKFARMAAFIFAYGATPFGWKKFPNSLLTKVLSMSNTFSITDCLFFSRGLQIAMELRFRRSVPHLIAMQISVIDTVLLSCAERHLNSENLTLNDLNMIVKYLSYSKHLRNSSVFREAFQKYKNIDCSQELNSRVIKEMAYNFSGSHVIIPEILEKMFNYIAANHEHIMGDTIEKLLSCIYNLGYTPQSLNVLHNAANIIMRDFNNMSGLAIVQSCLALCYYKVIPQELINRIFCVGFIQRIENEIQACYSRTTYPERVLNHVMQLNRTVCLDFPEANVPWFQQNYLEAHLSKKPFIPNEFNEDVKNLLTEIVKNKQYFRCNHTTPYGHQIDFVIHFDKDRNLIQPEPVETTLLDRITKVAILLLGVDSFCENDLTVLRGPQQLKINHLEMMGYKVLHINEYDWNSKYMNAPGAKANYLKCLLQISK